MAQAPYAESSDCGVIYVACGDAFRREAAQSLASLRKSNPGLPAHLLTDAEPEAGAGWDRVEVDPALAGRGNRAKLHMDRAPWSRCAFLDTDTLVVGELREGFALLERFDLAAVQGCGGHHYQIEGLPPSFPEFNSGVVFWRKGEASSEFFRRWRELFDHYAAVDQGRLWDQKSMRRALWEGELRVTSLPVNFNLMPYAPAVLDRDLVVAHGRNWVNLERLRDRLAGTGRARAYVPGVGVLEHPRQMSWRAIVRTVWRLVVFKIRSAVRG